MNSSREERAHRLADEVGRRDARDPEPVGDLGRDRRLARAGRAADEDHDRQVELAQLLVAAEAVGSPRRPPPRRASSTASRGEPVERRRRRCRGRGDRRRRGARARRRGRPESPTAISARAIRPREYGSPCSPPSGSGIDAARLAHARASAGRPSSANERVESRRSDDIVRRRARARRRRREPPRRRRRSRPPSARRDRPPRRCGPARSPERRGLRGCRETWTTSASR